MKEFDELIFSFMELDLNQKKMVLLNTLVENIDNVLNVLKSVNMNEKTLSTEILNNLKLSSEDEYLIHIYILIRQLEDITLKCITSRDMM